MNRNNYIAKTKYKNKMVQSGDVTVSIGELGRQQGLLLQRVNQTINKQMQAADANSYKYKITTRGDRLTWNLRYYRRIAPYPTKDITVRLGENYISEHSGGKGSKQDKLFRAMRGKVMGKEPNTPWGEMTVVRWENPAPTLKKVFPIRDIWLVYE